MRRELWTDGEVLRVALSQVALGAALWYRAPPAELVFVMFVFEILVFQSVLRTPTR